MLCICIYTHAVNNAMISTMLVHLPTTAMHHYISLNDAAENLLLNSHLCIAAVTIPIRKYMLSYEAFLNYGC